MDGWVDGWTGRWINDQRGLKEPLCPNKEKKKKIQVTKCEPTPAIQSGKRQSQGTSSGVDTGIRVCEHQRKYPALI